MKVIVHDDVTKQLPIVADDALLKTVDQSPSIDIVADNLLPHIAPRHQVIDGTLKLDPKSSWHALILARLRLQPTGACTINIVAVLFRFTPSSDNQ